MTLDEAIAHAEERGSIGCSECAREHMQLAQWLKELKELRKYAWHDLRKNPNDLPKTNGFSYIPCLICTESSPAEYAEYEYFEGYGWGFYGFNFESIKAWRYIEPFEVTE